MAELGAKLLYLHFGALEVAARGKELLEDFAGVEIEIGKVHAVGNRHENLLAAAGAVDLKAGAAIVYDKILAAVRAVKGYIGVVYLGTFYVFLYVWTEI